MTQTATATEVQVETELSPQEAADIIGISRSHLIYLANHGQIACRQTRLGRLFMPAEVERFRLSRTILPKRGRPSRADLEAAAALT